MFRHENCTLKIKEKIFSSLCELSEVSFIAIIFFMSDYAKTEDLAANYNSTDWLERYAIAQNKKTPLETIQLLAKDGNRIVRATAKENLANINYCHHLVK